MRSTVPARGASRGLLALLAFLASVAGPVPAQSVERSSARTSDFGFGTRALGMEGAFIAITDDASAVSWNPGDLVLLLDRQVTLTGSANDYETKTTGNQALRSLRAGSRSAPSTGAAGRARSPTSSAIGPSATT